MTRANAKEKFYGPLKQVATQYIPILMARMRVLQTRANGALMFLEDEELENEPEGIVSVAEAQSQLHKAVLEAGMCQTLVEAFADLLEGEYQKIRDSECYYFNEAGELESLYEDPERGV